MTAPTAEEVVMFAVHDARCPDRCDRTVIGITFGREAAAVVAAIRAMTVEQLVDLRPDLSVERLDRPEWFDTGEPRPANWGGLVGAEETTRHDVRFVPSVRVVGPWRAVSDVT